MELFLSTKNNVEARKLKGFRDFLPKQAKLRLQIISEVNRQAVIFGFTPVQTPSLEYADVLLGSGGQETDKEVYRFSDHGKRDVALRFDLTVPFARFITENFNELKMPFKRVQVGEVWRGEKPQKGRYRQFCQADFDIVGVDSYAADIEVIQILAACIEQLLPSSFTISLNDRSVLTGLIENILKNDSKELENKVLIAIDKLDKIGENKVSKMITDLGFKEPNVLSLLETLTTSDPKTLKEKLVTHLGETHPGLEKLYNIYRTLNEVTNPEKCHIKISPSTARGLGYYTGVVFETTIDALPGFGSIASGGRYNDLVARFGKHDLSGVGGSIGVDRLLAALEELKVTPAKESTSVYLAVVDEAARDYAFKLANELRQYGISIHLNVKPSKLAQQFKHADHLGCEYVAMVGEEEFNKGTLSIKRMKDGEEKHHIELAEAKNLQKIFS